MDLSLQIENALADSELVIDRSVSNAAQVYATDPPSRPLCYGSRVSLLASWTDQRNGEVQIEVRSDEPMLRRGTRCEQIAGLIQSRLE